MGGGSDRGSAFDRSVRGIAWSLVRFTVVTPPVVVVLGAVLRGRGVQAVPFAVSVGVALTPELLPLLVTTALAHGAVRLARRGTALVRRLPALHDLGSMDTLCVDKTGTLTLARPVLEDSPDPDALHWASVNAWWTLQLAEAPCPDALDEAVLDAGLPPEEYEGVDALPFDPVRRLSTAVVRLPSAPFNHRLVTKGAVDAVLPRCVLTDAERTRLAALADARAADGMRLLAVATAERPARSRAWGTADERGLTLVGFLAFADEVRPDAAAALRGLAASGVAVHVVTGDQPGAAAHACRALGLPDGPVVTGPELRGAADAAIAELAAGGAVFARCAPADKARIVGALRRSGRTVGHLGDGLNDVPALRAADVGIAPRGAADAPREAADVVLAGKDLAAVGEAVAAGRRSGAGIADYLRVTLSSNLGNVLAMLAAGVLVPFLPMLPAQVLVQNLCFDAAQSTFAFARPARADGGPRRLSRRRFLRFAWTFGCLNAAADLATFGVLALAAGVPAGDGDAVAFHSGWFTENLATQGLAMVLLRAGGGRPGGRRRDPVAWAAAVLAVLGVLAPFTPVGAGLGLAPLPVLYYPLLTAVLVLYAAALRRAARRADV
ncbi:hypothetical protein BIV57_19145 [Mangrovactinospora gilvigrisea]|uniref:Cation-transporting P-type ATPase C-terminal domain-containing protein n=2 Tax=Mangrovactinospora gilvigrisea TaxID=1428644 RepID=A0A1J7BR43_9ACTN|nr:hypothetical protein BIV57_19145 [Mangrovactinospora gilvigrisea]